MRTMDNEIELEMPDGQADLRRTCRALAKSLKSRSSKPNLELCGELEGEYDMLEDTQAVKENT